MNCTKNGILPIVLPQIAREKFAQLASNDEITVSLLHQKVICHDRIYSFDIDPTWKQKFIDGIDDIELTLKQEHKIQSFEKSIPIFE